MPVIEIEGLHKEYRRLRRGTTVAVEHLDLEVPVGGVFGFLGPNGSGKTTTIRCLLGLATPTRGHTRLLGTSPRDLHTVLARVGAIVETPTLFPNFTGRRNLALLGGIYGVGQKRVDEVLEQVGLAGRGDDLFKHYSLGMKQRLGIGAALLRDPELLILDEPANGLDPAGIKEVRDLIRALGAEGRTVFLSSHLLGEIQQVCDRVAILSRGRCIASGPVADVLALERTSALVVQLGDARAQGLEVVRRAGYQATVDPETGALRVDAPAGDAAEINRLLADQHLYASELRADAADLESVFLRLTSEAES